MDEEFIAKIYTLVPWLLLIIAILASAPVGHAVSLVDTASFQAAQVAKTGGDLTKVQNTANSVIASGLSIDTDGFANFDQKQDVNVDRSNPPYVKVTVQYHITLLETVTSLAGWAGPSFTIARSHNTIDETLNNEGIPSQ